MAQLNFNIPKFNFLKEKSKDEIARKRLETQGGNPGFLAGGIFSCLALLYSFIFIFVSENIPTKVILSIVCVAALALGIFFFIKHAKCKTAMQDILEAFLAGERNVSNIATNSGLKNNECIRLIQAMISKGIIIDAYIDRMSNKIIDKEKTVGSAKDVGKIVNCSGCGAKNTITGLAGQKCEYCGALLNIE